MFMAWNAVVLQRHRISFILCLFHGIDVLKFASLFSLLCCIRQVINWDT